MRTEEKTSVKNSVGRLILVALTVLFQIAWIIVLSVKLNNYSTVISLFTSILALFIVLQIYLKRTNAAFKMPWMILILTFPPMGICLYLIMGRLEATPKKRKHFEKIDEKLEGMLPQNQTVMDNLQEKDKAVANQAYYILHSGKYPVYRNTEVVFYDDAAKGIAAQKEELEKAQKFIFMEYHAIEDAQSFRSIRDILKKKAAQGVEVRIFYDDIGSIGFINHDFIKRMEADGIACRVFNPVAPAFNIFMNNRDHRKITVVDGKVGFTGGYNLANEYFNITHPYGHWKDTGVKLTGEAVRSLTAMFLEMWNAIEETDEDFEKFLPEITNEQVEKSAVFEAGKGFVQPYADTPLDDELLGENVYMNIIKNAKDYVYFTTPYLIISDEMIRELTTAAKRGIDVRIITPGIPDKKLVFEVTRSYYGQLVDAGVRVYEYTPGFIHAKQCVSDGEVATVGTINLDYRSLHFHFENGVFLYDCDAVGEIRKDFDRTFPMCEEVTEKYRNRHTASFKIRRCVLRLLAPLL